MHKTSFIFLPEAQGSIEEELVQCLELIDNICMKGYKPVRLNFFTDVPDFESFLRAREEMCGTITGFFGNGCPAFNITCHPPEYPLKTAVEGSFVYADNIKVLYKNFEGIPYVVLEDNSVKEVWACGVSSYSSPGDTRKAAESAFEIMIRLLENEKMTLNNIVRQWNYIGNILSVNHGIQNYQAFNDVRSEFYGKYRNKTWYPAATGVGMKHGGVILDFCAADSCNGLKIFAESNPSQVNAYEYDQKVLKGAPSEKTKKKQPPQFERALLVACRDNPVLFISGTASIIGQDTIGKDDVAKQTEVTIENIFRLKESNRLGELTGDSVPAGGRFSLVRIYVKLQKDFRIVKQICEKTFTGIPMIFIEADICRDDLLTEIEAEYLL